MDQLLKLAQDSGMSESQGETATGGLFSMLKNNVSSEDFAKIQQQLPGVDGAVEKYSSGGGSGDGNKGGLGGMLGSAMSSLGGGSGSGGSSTTGDMAGLLTALTSQGINPAMVQKFLPQVAALVKSQCGIDISQYIGGAGGSSSSGSSGGASNLLSQGMSMFGK